MRARLTSSISCSNRKPGSIWLSPSALVFLGILSLLPWNVAFASDVAVDDVTRLKSYVVDLGGFVVDQPYVMMTGPTKVKYISLPLQPNVKKVWLKGMMVQAFSGENAEAKESLTSLCHAALLRETDVNGYPIRKILTISEGLERMEFPPGYGYPISPGEAIAVSAQVQNEDPALRKTYTYRFTIWYVEDNGSDGEKPLIPLMAKPFHAVGTRVALKDGVICGEGDGSLVSNRSMHFLVPPGQHEFSQIYPPGGYAEKDVRLHEINMHFHRYGMKSTLIDRTDKKILWEGRATYDTHGQIAHVDHYSSEEGILIRANHEYEIRSVYNNPTNKNVDGMATMRSYYSIAGE